MQRVTFSTAACSQKYGTLTFQKHIVIVKDKTKAIGEMRPFLKLEIEESLQSPVTLMSLVGRNKLD